MADAASISLASETYVQGFLDATIMAPAADGRVFVGQRTEGEVWVVRNGSIISRGYARLPVNNLAEGGLLGITLDPDFKANHHLYIFHTYGAADGSPRSRIVRLTDLGDSAGEMVVIFDNIPAASIHNGGILAFGPDGKLYVTLGDHTQAGSAQDVGSLNGKVLRLNPDGTLPTDNPFPGSPVFTLGHRNVFGLAFDPVSGRAFITENGPSDSDEVNVLQAGGNYGWPTVRGAPHDPRFIDPILVFQESIAPTNAIFYTGDKLPAQVRNNLLFGDYLGHRIHLLTLDPGSSRALLNHDVVYTDPSGPVLDIKQGIDGYVYFTTGGSIRRLVGVDGAGQPTPSYLLPLAITAILPPLGILGYFLARRRWGSKDTRPRPP